MDKEGHVAFHHKLGQVSWVMLFHELVECVTKNVRVEVEFVSVVSHCYILIPMLLLIDEGYIWFAPTFIILVDAGVLVGNHVWLSSNLS